MAFVPLVGTERAGTGAKIIGKADPQATIQVTVHIQRSDDPQNTRFKSFVRELINRGNSARKHLTRQEYADAYGITQSDLQKVRKFAREHGLRVVPDRVVEKTNASQFGHRTVELRGTVGAFNRAFQVRLMKVQDAQGVYRTYQGAISIPEEYSDVIGNVLGLETRPQAKPRFKRARLLGGSKLTAGLPTYTPVDVAKLYNFPPGTGKGQTIALLELGGGVRRRDVRTYFKQLGIPAPKVKFVSVGRGRNKPSGPNSADGEVMLDLEVAGAVASGATIVLYFAPNATSRGFLRAVNAAVHDNVHKPSIISISWGGPEGTWTTKDMTSMDEAFQAAAAMGTSVFVAAGDAGSTDTGKGSVAHVDFPGSSPHVTACGGTRMISLGGAIVETVWNDSPTSGGGGGISDVFDPPDYQQRLKAAGCLTSVNPGSRVGRGVPDIAGNADPSTGYKVRVDGVDTVIGGTSAVAPLWAGLFALINEDLQNVGRPLAGFANPFLYSTTMANSPALRDITIGNNDTTGKVGGYSAGLGWDPCTGWGTPASGVGILNAIKLT